jgi:hypothetical protein
VLKLASSVASQQISAVTSGSLPVDHYFAKLMTTAAIGLAQFGMEDT